MKWAAVITFCWTLQKLIPSTFSANQCNLANKYAPINLDTDSAIEVVTKDSLLFTLDNNDRFKVQNTGNTVEIMLAQPETVTGASKGVLGERFYMQYKVRYFWNQDYSGDCSFSLDQSKYPVNLEFVYYYEKSKSYENARKEPNGLLVVRVPVTVEGVVTNPLFTDFENILRNITEPGASFLVNGSARKLIYKWFEIDQIHYPYYYTYEGLYKDESQNETMYSNAIYIVFPKTTTAYMSTKQFTAFTCLKSKTGLPIASIESGYPPKNRLVKQAKGTVEKVFNDRYPPSQNFQFELPDSYIN